MQYHHGQKNSPHVILLLLLLSRAMDHMKAGEHHKRNTFPYLALALDT